MHREQWSEKESAKERARKRKVNDEDEGRRLRERKRESIVGPSYLRSSRKVWICEGSDERKLCPAYII